MAKRKSKKIEATPELKAKAKKMHQEGKSYKQIADALHLGYDKAAWNLINEGPTGKHRGEGGKSGSNGKGSGKAPSKAQGGRTGDTGGGKRKAAGKGVGAAAGGPPKAGKARKEEGTQSPAPVAAPPKQAGSSTPVPPSPDTDHRFGRGMEKPVARPAEEVHPVPKPSARKPSARERTAGRVARSTRAE